MRPRLQLGQLPVVLRCLRRFTPDRHVRPSFLERCTRSDRPLFHKSAETSAPEHYMVPTAFAALPEDSELPGGADALNFSTLTPADGTSTSELGLKSAWFEQMTNSSAAAMYPNLVAIMWFNLAKIGGYNGVLRLSTDPSAAPGWRSADVSPRTLQMTIARSSLGTTRSRRTSGLRSGTRPRTRSASTLRPPRLRLQRRATRMGRRRRARFPRRASSAELRRGLARR